jgi:hypothetical protein
MAWYDFALRGADRFVRAAEDAISTLGDAIESVGEDILEAEIGLSGKERRRRRRAARRQARRRRAGIFRARLEENRRRKREAKGKPPRLPRKRRKAKGKPLPPRPPRPTPAPATPYQVLPLDFRGEVPSNEAMVREDYQRAAYATRETGHLSAESLLSAGVPAASMAYVYWFDGRPLPFVLYVGKS